uniref:Uncharacterized protein n=1 Tax=Lates calcarifer TaxID=8187 RepID=A0A4W6FBV6_LATCA
MLSTVAFNYTVIELIWCLRVDIYNKLKICVDDWAKVSWCWGSPVDKVFLEVHQTYFSLCGQVRDPPLTTLIMLITPVTIATLFLPLLSKVNKGIEENRG